MQIDNFCPTCGQDGDNDTGKPRRVATPAISDDFLLPVLAALAKMASGSRRREAETLMAVRAFGLTIGQGLLAAVVVQLEAEACITRPIPLNDGGSIVMVTATGFDRLRGTMFSSIWAAVPFGR